MTLKAHFLAAAVAASAMLLSANTSFAWFGHHHGSCGSYGGGWGGSHGGSWGYGGSWGSGGGWGSCGSHGGGYAYGGYYGGGYYGGGYASSRVMYDGIVSDSPSTSTYASAVPTVRTRLTIHVPADAKLMLAGVDTKQNGEVRQFATNRLAAGQAWDGYKVVAEMERNGQTVREERTLKLIGGEAQELAINFDSSKVASN